MLIRGLAGQCITSQLPAGGQCGTMHPSFAHFHEDGNVQSSMVTALSEVWHGTRPGLEPVQDALTRTVEAFSPDLADMPSLIQTTLQQCQQQFQNLTPARSQNAPKHRANLAQMWHACAELRKPRLCNLRSILQSWQMHTRLHTLKKRLKASCTRAKV